MWVGTSGKKRRGSRVTRTWRGEPSPAGLGRFAGKASGNSGNSCSPSWYGPPGVVHIKAHLIFHLFYGFSSVPTTWSLPLWINGVCEKLCIITRSPIPSLILSQCFTLRFFIFHDGKCQPHAPLFSFLLLFWDYTSFSFRKIDARRQKFENTVPAISKVNPFTGNGQQCDFLDARYLGVSGQHEN